MTTATATTNVPTIPTALPAVSWCHDCRVDTAAVEQAGVPGQHLIYLATQTRSSLDGPIDVCDGHADMHDDLAADDAFADLDDLDDVDLDVDDADADLMALADAVFAPIPMGVAA